MKLEINTDNLHPVDTAKSAVKSVGSGIVAAGDKLIHTSPATIATDAADVAMGTVHGLGRLFKAVGSKLEGKS